MDKDKITKEDIDLAIKAGWETKDVDMVSLSEEKMAWIKDELRGPNMINWLKHVYWWITSFPLTDYHYMTGLVGEREMKCLVCGKIEIDDMSERDLERERRMSDLWSEVYKEGS